MYILKEMIIFLNILGVINVEEVVRIVRIFRKMGCGDFIKIEVILDIRYLFFDNEEIIKVIKIFVDEGFIVFLYMILDFYVGRRFIEVNVVVVMLFGVLIGLNRGF